MAASFKWNVEHGAADVRGGKYGHTHIWTEMLNPSTSAKPVMTTLQNLFVALVNMDIFQMTLKLRLFTVDF